MKKMILMYCSIGTIIFCIDRVTKYLALMWCDGKVCLYGPFLSFELVVNRGISWGMFHSSHNGTFVVVSLIIGLTTLIVCWYAAHLLQKGLPIIGNIYVIAGSLSNLIDRIYYGGVIDFIVLSYHQMSWPVFNVADMAIVLGVGIMLYQSDM